MYSCSLGVCECVCVLAKEGEGDGDEEKRQEQGPICQHSARNPSHSTRSPMGQERETTHLWQCFFVKNGVAPVNKNSTYKRLVLFKLNLHTKAAHARNEHAS